MLIVKILFALCAVVVFLVGLHMVRNFERIFGANIPVPNETEGSRLLNKTQVILLWLMVFKLMATMAVIL